MRLRTLKDISLKDKKVLLRVDFNVPLGEAGEITDDFRIRAHLPTIKRILDAGAKKITLISHLGRPKDKEENLRLEGVARRLGELLGEETEVLNEQYQIGEKTILLENLRFDKREKENNEEFAKLLAHDQDVFVNDAFAVMHRADASVVGVAKFLPSVAGPLVEKEVENLEKLLENPQRPFIVIIGGAKVEDKGPVIEVMLKIADKILVGGKTANELLATKKYQNENKVVLPEDGVGQPWLDIGPKSTEKFIEIIKTAKTIYWNGNLGKSEEKEYANGSIKVAETIVSSSAYKVISGGDTVGFIRNLGLENKFDFVSSGGGAASEFLVKGSLPGLDVLKL